MKAPVLLEVISKELQERAGDNPALLRVLYLVALAIDELKEVAA